MTKQRGDTIVEVILAVTIFSLVAVGGMAVMNQGTAAAQRALEIGLVRAQIDAQADALRYAHNAYVSSLGSGDSEAKTVWSAIAQKHAVTSSQNIEAVSDGQKCVLPDPTSFSVPAGAAFTSSDRKPFALETRRLDGKNTDTPSGSLTVSDPTITYSSYTGPVPISSTAVNAPVTYAQLHYDDPGLHDASTDAVAHGVWMQAVYTKITGTPGYYDFNIRACWVSPGQQAPVTLGTVVRLYDPEV